MQNMLRTVTGVESYRGYMDFLIYLCRGRLTNKEMPVAFLCLKMVGEGEERENKHLSILKTVYCTRLSPATTGLRP